MNILLKRSGREKLINMLDRFWTKFCKYWEVLLNGNPAVDALGGLKLAAGGELGMGVGEEEWGSGEREVLEDLVHRTGGLMDLVVSRFGNEQSEGALEDDIPWLGSGQPPDANDGVIFGGVGALSRGSVRDIANWVQQVFTYGDYAYGIRDNPARKRRRRPAQARSSETVRKTSQKPSSADAGSTSQLNKQAVINAAMTAETSESEAQDEDLTKVPSLPPVPPDPRPAIHERVASQDHAPGSPSLRQPLDDHRPGIPPPIVSAAEQALAKATAGAQKRSQPNSPDLQGQHSGSVISDKWMKYLTLGLSTLAKPDASDSKHKESQVSSPGLRTPGEAPHRLAAPPKEPEAVSEDEGPHPILTQLEPMPDGYLAISQIAEQKRLESQGYFLIGYRGQLGPLPAGNDIFQPLADEAEDDRDGERLLLRTIYVEAVKKFHLESPSDHRTNGSSALTVKNDNMAVKMERVRVVVYIRRPFIYTFMFEQRASGPQMASFYTSLHHHMAPLQKPMSLNTSMAHVGRLIEESKEANTVPESPVSSKSSTKGSIKSNHKATLKTLPVYDLLYDPDRLTVHSTIPNIPLPGTAAAEGLGVEEHAVWTRIEGLNVHAQILNTLESTRNSSREVERSAKTSRGWWVVWMRLPPSSQPERRGPPTLTHENSNESDESDQTLGFSQASEYETLKCQVAIVVRKASDWTAPKASTSSARMGAGMFGFGRSGEDVTGGHSGGWGPASLTTGMGFDARRYVEGLLSLNR